MIGQGSGHDPGRWGDFGKTESQDHPITGPVAFNQTGPGCVEFGKINVIPKAGLGCFGDVRLWKLKAVRLARLVNI